MGILWLWAMAQIRPCFFSVGHNSGTMSSIDFSPSFAQAANWSRLIYSLRRWLAPVAGRVLDVAFHASLDRETSGPAAASAAAPAAVFAVGGGFGDGMGDGGDCWWTWLG